MSKNHKLSENEKRLRDHLTRSGVRGGDELWTIVKSGWNRSYSDGQQDVTTDLLERARQRILEWRDEGDESGRGKDFEEGVLALLVDVFNEDWETVRCMLFANHPEFFTDMTKSEETTTDDSLTTLHFAEDTSSEWKSTSEFNRMFIRQVGSYLGEVLKKRGMICLNDVRLELGMEVDREGYRVVWSTERGDILKWEVDDSSNFGIDITVGIAPKKVLTQSNAPVALVALLGYPDNKRFIVKNQRHEWIDIESGDIIDHEDFRAGWLPYFADIEMFEPVES